MFMRIVFCLFAVWCTACGGALPDPEGPLDSSDFSASASQQSDSDSSSDLDSDLNSDSSADPDTQQSEPGDPDGQPSDEMEIAFNSYVRALKKMNTAQSLSEPEQIGTAQTNWHGDDYTVTARYRAAPEFIEVLALDPGSDVIWPGAILQGESAEQNNYVPATGKRAPLRVSISPENVHGKGSAVVDTPCLLNIRQAVLEVLSQKLIGVAPARVSFSIEEVYDAQQLALAVGASMGNANDMIKAQFDFSNAAPRSRILVKLFQIYYTLDIDLPNRPSELFANDADLNAIRDNLHELSPLYISSVSYGRMAFFSFESAEDIETLKAAVNASCQALLDGANGDISPAHKAVFGNTNISATVIDGDGVAAVTAINDFDEFKLHFLQGGNYDRNSSCAEISYTMRYLSDNSKARFVLTGEYDVKQTCRGYDWYAIRDLRLACGDENGAGNSAKFFGMCDVSMKTNGVNVPGYENGSPAPSRVWAVLTQQSSNWNLDPGQWKSFGTERLFRVRRLDLDKAVLRVNGEVYKYGLILDSLVGKKELSITLNAIPGSMIWLPQFVDGNTKARIGFSITRLDP
jgi:thiol-activated cytolysin